MSRLKYEISIECENAAFGDTHAELEAEVAGILQSVLDRLNCLAPMPLRDSSGNTVGRAGISSGDLDKWQAERSQDDQD